MADFYKFWHYRLGRPFRLYYDYHRPKQRGRRDGKTVLLLHGIASDRDIWDPLVEELRGRGCNVLAPDLLGHGKSPRPNFISYSTEDQARAVLALLKRLKLKRVIVVGHSMGCLVATRLATTTPERVSRLLLYEPPLFADMPEFKTHAKRRKFYYDLYERIAKNPAGTITVARIVARVAKNWTSYLQSEQTWLPIERSLRNSIMQQTSFEELRNTTVQTDIVHGRLDVVVPKAELKLMLKDNVNIKFYRTIDRHGISSGSARYLARLIAPKPKEGDNGSTNQGGRRASSLERSSHRRSRQK